MNQKEHRIMYRSMALIARFDNGLFRVCVQICDLMEWTLRILMLLKLLKRGLNVEKCKAKISNEAKGLAVADTNVLPILIPSYLCVVYSEFLNELFCISTTCNL